MKKIVFGCLWEALSVVSQKWSFPTALFHRVALGFAPFVSHCLCMVSGSMLYAFFPVNSGWVPIAEMGSGRLRSISSVSECYGPLKPGVKAPASCFQFLDMIGLEV